ncbi:MAG TPA: CopG family transcriptional regulator [Mycobacterium sp.]
MRRIQLYLPEDMDAALAAEAARRGVSKAALVRELVGHSFGRPGRDPIDDVIGIGDGAPVDDIDAAVYGSA